MSDTPRTDAITPLGLAKDGSIPHYVIELAGLCRNLERELNECKAKLFELENMGLFALMTPAEIVQAKRDAERYRWVRDRASRDEVESWLCMSGMGHTPSAIESSDTDAAIDKARGAT